MTDHTVARRRLWLVSAACFALALTTTLFGFADPTTWNSPFALSAIFFGLMGILVVQLALGKAWLQTRVPGSAYWAHPPFLMTAWTLLFLGVPGAYSLLRPDVLLPLQLFSIDPAYTVRGMWLVVIGCALLWLSYGAGYAFWKTPASAQRLAQQPVHQMVALAFFVALGVLSVVQIALVGIAYGISLERWGALAPFRQWVGYAQDATYLLLALVALKIFRKEWPRRYLLFVVVPLIGLSFISGFMKPLFWIMLILATSALIVGVNLRRFVVPALLFFMLGLLIVPVTEDLRSRADIGLVDTRDPIMVAGSAADAMANLWRGGNEKSWSYAFDRTLYRNAIVASTPGIIMEKTPSVIPYQGIDKFLAIPAYVIPRALWPDKPILSRGQWFGMVYLNQPEFINSSAAITIFGEGYMYAGWIGTVLACLLLGFQLAAIYRFTAGAGLWAVYISLIPTFIDAEAQFTGMFVALVQRSVVFLAVYALMVWLSQPKSVGKRPGHALTVSRTSSQESNQDRAAAPIARAK